MRAQDKSTLRVLQVISGLDPAAGGPPAAAMATSLALRAHGVANSFAYADGSGLNAAANAELLAAEGIDTYRFPITRTTGAPGVRWGISFRLAVWLLRNARGFDVLHTHGAWTFTSVASLAAARLRGRVVVLTSHESLTDFDRKKSGPLHSRLKQLLRWVFLRSFDVVVVASPLEQDDMRDPAGLRSVVVPHAVFAGPGEPRISASGNELRVGFLGRLHPKKNVELLIDAVASLDGHVSLHVAGDGPRAYRDSLVSRASSRGVAGRIQWVGFVQGAAKRRFLESIDVLVMPSAFEGFGVAAAEAIVAGVPVIVSSQTGIAALVERHGCGAVIEPDEGNLRSELERHAFLRGDARNATSLARAELSPEVHGARLKRVYDELVNQRRLRRHA